MAQKIAKLIGSDAQDAAWAIHHCLKYISQDALELGMSQTANLLDISWSTRQRRCASGTKLGRDSR